MNNQNFKDTWSLISYSKKYIKGKALDLGAGTGKYKNVILEAASEYIAFDKIDAPNIDVTGDVTNTPFSDNDFDTIVSTGVLEHVPDPWAMVREVRRMLKEGGVCVAMAPFMHPYHEDPGDYFRYTKEGIKCLFEKGGFEVLEYGSMGKLYTVLYVMIKYLFFHPYGEQKRGTWRINQILIKIANFLNKFVKTEIFYDSVYIIAKKK